jgi:hypothetical protein
MSVLEADPTTTIEQPDTEILPAPPAAPTGVPRRRAMAFVGAFVFAIASGRLFAGTAYAAPCGCYGFDTCDCCAQNQCCEKGCTSYYGAYATSCWTGCCNGKKVLCCDWQNGGSKCICSGTTGANC